jgi:[Skp1-protein]-hydroxyproline N-acetylglucosaminyltransferase
MLQSGLTSMYSAPAPQRRRRAPEQQAPPPPQRQSAGAAAASPLPPPPSNSAAAATAHDLIFVSIPSYRDSEVIATLEDLYRKAKYPHRVVAGVCQQIDEVKDRAFDVRHTTNAIIKRHMENIRIMTLPSTEAKGPSYARFLIEQQLFDDETFYMGIDSHSAFTPNWDILAIDELLKCHDEKPMLTVYPQDYVKAGASAGGKGGGVGGGNAGSKKTNNAGRTINPRLPVPFLKFHTFHPTLNLPITERVPYKRNPRTPLPSLYLSAGFVFTLGEIIRESPYDPLPYAFTGEEILMAAKYWTAGVNLFSPSKNIVYHYNDRTYRPLFWENFYKSSNGRPTHVPEDLRRERKAIEQESLEHIHELLNREELGPNRPMRAFWGYTGLDMASKTATRNASFGLSPNPSREESICKTGS